MTGTGLDNLAENSDVNLALGNRGRGLGQRRVKKALIARELKKGLRE